MKIFVGVILIYTSVFAQSADPISFEEYDPPSSLVVAEHVTTHSKFPFIDVHNHQWDITEQDLEELLDDMDKLSRAEYDHKWLGKYLDSVDGAIIKPEWLDACLDAHKLPHLAKAFEPRGAVVVAHDPFDDGNGRVTRALTDRALAQDEKTSIRFYSLSAAIEMNRSGYYDILENTQGCNTETQVRTGNNTDITEWINWFLEVLAQAMQQGQRRIDNVIDKARFWQKHSQTALTDQQIKVLNRLLDGAGEEFADGINATKYQGIADVSKATATRHLKELLTKGCLTQLPGGGRSTRYAINTGQ